MRPSASCRSSSAIVDAVDLEARPDRGRLGAVDGLAPAGGRCASTCVTLFPEMVAARGRVRRSPAGRAERGLWSLGAWNPRDFATDSYRTVDDRPYGGGPGMVMMAEPLEQAIAAARAAQRGDGVARTRTIYLSPAGRPLTHARVVGARGGRASGAGAARRALRRRSTSG